MNKWLGIAALLVTASAAGQDFSAERPSFSSSPLALATGYWQLEGGFQYFKASDDVDGFSLPNGLLRYGAGERAEIQLGWTGYARFDTSGGDVDGFTDASLGVKWQLSEDNATTPLALFAGVSLPVGGDELSSDELDPAVGLFWGHNGRVSLFGTVLLSESASQTTIGNAVGINLPLERRCNHCSAYLEYVGIHAEGSGPQHSLNGGYAWMTRPNLQFDVNAGFGLNDRAADGYFGFGAAYRF